MARTLYIDGQWREPSSGEYRDVIDPATGEAFTTAAMGDAEDVDAAVAAARGAFEEWGEVDARDRVAVLLELADVVEANHDELVELETRENGKPLAESENDVGACAAAFRYYAGAADKHHGDTIPERNDVLDLTQFEPYGVVGVVIPWNWPPMHVCDFLAPALACGNAVVLKPAPETPLSALRLAELFDDVLPDGVFNVVPGEAEAGAALTGHAGVDKIAFTGNSETGSLVMESAAEHVTSSMMELGGKNANIIFPDADLDRVVPGAVGAAFYNTGEACSSSERLLLHESIREEFLDRFFEEIESSIVVGDGTDPDTTMGPLTTQAQYDKVTEYVEVGKRDGATLAYSGDLPATVENSGGYFVAPHVFTDVDPSMRIFREEIFGPVLSVTTFASESEAVELANDVPYGLTGGIWTGDGERGMRVAQQLDVGMVYLNNFDREMLGAPFGGYGRSGNGRKLAFEETMREFSRVKNIRYGMGGDLGFGG